MVDFRGDSHSALVALCAAMVSIVYGQQPRVVWYTTSESHALIAGLSGANSASGGLSGINPAEW